MLKFACGKKYLDEIHCQRSNDDWHYVAKSNDDKRKPPPTPLIFALCMILQYLLGFFSPFFECELSIKALLQYL